MKTKEEFIDSIPAIKRRKECMGCGNMFYQGIENQSLCQDCLDEAEAIESKAGEIRDKELERREKERVEAH